MTRSRFGLFVLAVFFAAAPVAAQPSLSQVRERERTRAYRECSDESIRRLALVRGDAAADIGAGYGFYSEQLSRIVGPSGRVYAVEVDDASLRALRQRVSEGGLKNVEVIEGRADDPLLAPASLNAIIVVRAYHDMREPKAMLQKMYAALRPGGRLVMLDHRSDESTPSDSRERQVAEHELAIDLVAGELKAAGFEVVEKRNSVCDGQPDASSRGERLWLMVARRPQ